MNPITAINQDRQVARGHDDRNADICFLALTHLGQPSVRTLVLREVSITGLTLFVNRTSPKWQALQENPKAEALMWFPSIQRQYRVTGTLTELERSIIEKNWPRRPAGSKYLDHSYGVFADQSKPIGSRRELIDHVTALRSQVPEDQLTTPDTATGVVLVPDRIECLDLNRPDRIHERRLFTREGETWAEQQLMP